MSDLLLTAAQLQQFHRDGWLALRGVLDPGRVAEVSAFVDQLAEWAEAGGPGLHHFEQTDAGPAIARSEDFVPHHVGLRQLICAGPVLRWVSELMGEPAVLFKEKVNYKHPGGGGFAPHQDATAYRFADHHISVMVPLDPATLASGCLWFAPGHTQGEMPNNGRGRMDEAFSAGLDWQAIEAMPGDVVLFDSYAPHRSDTNRTDRPRRALYLTYNALSAGDLREAYYADKRAELAAADGTFGGARVRMSINDDFLGRPVEGRVARAAPPIEDLLRRYEGPLALRLYDEAITELAHGLQSAELADAEGAPPALVAAALLHDVGHLLIGDLAPIEAELGKDHKHDEVAARYLARWFGPEVTEPVALHVAAKRYLVAVEPGYADGLSLSSVRSLAVQGGPMSADEVAAFERRPGWEGAVRLRRWDDLAKDAAVQTRPFSAFHDLLRGLARA